MMWQNAPDIALSEKKKQELNNQCDLATQAANGIGVYFFVLKTFQVEDVK